MEGSKVGIHAHMLMTTLVYELHIFFNPTVLCLLILSILREVPAIFARQNSPMRELCVSS